MLYAILFLIALAVALYVTSRWLNAELRHAGGWLSEKLLLARGGQTPERMIADTRDAFAARELEPHCMLVSRQVARSYEHLRRAVIGRRVSNPLPAAVVFVLAVDVDRQFLYLRAVSATADDVGRDQRWFIPFRDIHSIEPVESRLPGGVSPGADTVLEIRTAEHPPCHLALEREWGVSPAEMHERIRAMIRDGWKPDGAPVVVR